MSQLNCVACSRLNHVPEIQPIGSKIVVISVCPSNTAAFVVTTIRRTGCIIHKPRGLDYGVTNIR